MVAALDVGQVRRYRQPRLKLANTALKKHNVFENLMRHRQIVAENTSASFDFVVRCAGVNWAALYRPLDTRPLSLSLWR
jgi:hypothetical protein